MCVLGYNSRYKLKDYFAVTGLCLSSDPLSCPTGSLSFLMITESRCLGEFSGMCS